VPEKDQTDIVSSLIGFCVGKRDGEGETGHFLGSAVFTKKRRRRRGEHAQFFNAISGFKITVWCTRGKTGVNS
jgi:hypothetical protein